MSHCDEWMENGMNSKWKALGAALAMVVVSGCAGMSDEECLATDWSAVGYEDGARGYTAERFSRHRTACAKHGITADFGAYQAGREQGLVEYCQPGRGYDVGVSGGRYYGVCSADLEPDFLAAYNEGYHLYTLRANVNRANANISSRERELEDVENEMRAKEAALIAPETTTQDRILLVADLKELSERTGELEAEIQMLYEERARAQAELDNYQARAVEYGY
jgi:hypothetical protein